ncbi:Ku protein [Streptomyces sp. NBC_00829]|uniref:non-homologous end joining protein Ku n=1 Tax=Streptomyces sp. NBC_00829 TaxID=2903679 RepID=UPI002F907C80|nr:Ku protein [Streptomyces sp. NBC_00829]
MPVLLSTAVQFGLVSIPVAVVSATESHSVSFRQIHLEDGGRVRNRKICQECGQQLRQDEIGRGWELPDGSLMEVTDEDLDSLPLEHVRAIEVIGFNQAESVNPISLGHSYYLAAKGAIAAKPYTLITKALQRTDKIAVVRYSLRDRTRLGLLRVKDDVLLLQQLLAPDEVRSPTLVGAPEADVEDDEVQGALQLAEAFDADDLSGFRDTYTDALTEIINAKIEGREAPAVPEQEGPGAPVVDLMAALNESVAKARATRGDTGQDATVHTMTAPKKRAAKKSTTATVKKAAAKKTAAKKSSGRKPRSA